MTLAAGDLLTAGLAFARERAPRAALYQLDARRLPFEREFDVVGAFDVLEHIKMGRLCRTQSFRELPAPRAAKGDGPSPVRPAPRCGLRGDACRPLGRGRHRRKRSSSGIKRRGDPGHVPAEHDPAERPASPARHVRVNPYTERRLDMALPHRPGRVDFNDFDWLVRQPTATGPAGACGSLSESSAGTPSMRQRMALCRLAPGPGCSAVGGPPHRGEVSSNPHDVLVPALRCPFRQSRARVVQLDERSAHMDGDPEAGLAGVRPSSAGPESAPRITLGTCGKSASTRFGTRTPAAHTMTRKVMIGRAGPRASRRSAGVAPGWPRSPWPLILAGTLKPQHRRLRSSFIPSRCTLPSEGFRASSPVALPARGFARLAGS